MLNRRTFIKVASALSFVASAPAALAARGRTKTVRGRILSVHSETKTFDILEGDYEGYGDSYHVKVTRKTKIKVKVGDRSPRPGSFDSLEEDLRATVKGRILPGEFNLQGTSIIVFIPDYDYGY